MAGCTEETATGRRFSANLEKYENMNPSFLFPLVQLPEDATAAGYKKTGAFSWAQVFTSAVHEFTGTEAEFIAAGLAYRFKDAGPFRRMVTNPAKP